jgi:tight adherence protein C
VTVNSIPIIFGAALFTALCGAFRIIADLSSIKGNDARNQKRERLLITLLTSLTISLVVKNMLVLPLSFVSLNSLILITEKRKRAKRSQTLNRELSFVALSLSLLIDAGCSIQSAVEKLSASFPAGPSKEFLKDIKNLFEIGADTRKVKGEISRYNNSRYGDLLLEILITGKALGSGPGKSLKQLSEKILDDRVLLADEKALKAPVKLMVPLCLFIFPAIFLLIFSPVILQIGGALW